MADGTTDTETLPPFVAVPLAGETASQLPPALVVIVDVYG